MRAAIYERISMDKTGEAAGVTRQDEDCRALAAELGWSIVEIYVDNDVSATSGKPRPSYRRMLADIEAGRIDAIVAWHTDRLYRRVRDLEELVEICERHHVAVKTCRAGELDLSTPTGRMLARILGSVAQHEVEQKADRWLRSYRQRREAGKWMASGPRTFGYTRQGEIVPEEVEIVRQVADDLFAGTSMAGVCVSLNDRGVHTTRGNDWTIATLRQYLNSPRIAGLSVLDGEIIGKGAWEPILDRPTWERLRAVIKRPGGWQRPPRRSLLTRLIVCGIEDCGRPLRRAGGGRGHVSVFRCGTESRSRGHVTIAANTVEAMVEAAARAALSNDEVRAGIAARLSGAGDAAATLTREIDNLESEIRELEIAMQEAGTRSKISLARSIDDLAEQVDAKRRQLTGLSPVELPEGDDWPTDVDRRAALIALVVKRVVIRPAKHRGGAFDPERVEIVPTYRP